MKSNDNIIITHCPLKTNKDEVFLMIKEDESLIYEIKKYSKELLNDNIETFEQRCNIIVTERGYYCAFYENDLKLVDK
jgi:hypothetical protein